jgi:hypothetical protein
MRKPKQNNQLVEKKFPASWRETGSNRRICPVGNGRGICEVGRADLKRHIEN